MDGVRQRLLTLWPFFTYAAIVLLLFRGIVSYPFSLVYKDNVLPLPDVASSFYAWSTELLGHFSISTSFTIVAGVLSGMFGSFLVQKLLILSVLFLPFASFQFFIPRSFRLRRETVFVAAVVHALNPVVMDLLWGGNGGDQVALIYAAGPLFLYSLLKVRGLFGILLLAALLSFLDYNSWTLVVQLAFIALFALVVRRPKGLVATAKRVAIFTVAAVALSGPNLPFNISRLRAVTGPTASFTTQILADIKWSYGNANWFTVPSLASNKANYVYHNMFFPIAYPAEVLYFAIFLFVLGSLFTVVREGASKEKTAQIASVAFSVLLIGIILAVTAAANFPLPSSLLTLLGAVREQDKLLMPYVFFLCLALSFSLERVWIRFSSLSRRSLLNVATVTVLLILVLAPLVDETSDGFGGLTNFLGAGVDDSIQRISLLPYDGALPTVVSRLNLSASDRIAILPYGAYDVAYDAMDQLKTMPYLQDVVGIRSGGVLDGYDNSTISLVTDFFSAIVNGKADKVDAYAQILGVRYFLVKTKDQNCSSSPSLLLGIQHVPFVCGPPKAFLDYFTTHRYVEVYDGDGYAVFSAKQAPYPLVYALGSYPIDFGLESETGHLVYRSFDNLSGSMLVANSDALFGFNLSLQFRVEKGGPDSWNSFSMLLGYRDAGNFVRLTFPQNSGVEVGLMENGSYTPREVFAPVTDTLGTTHAVDVIKIGSYLEVHLDGPTVVRYVDSVLDGGDLRLWFDQSTGEVHNPQLQGISFIPLAYSESSPATYLAKINFTGPALVAFSESFDTAWGASVRGSSTIRSTPLFLGFNGFAIDLTGPLSLTIQYGLQEWYLGSMFLTAVLLVGILALATVRLLGQRRIGRLQPP